MIRTMTISNYGVRPKDVTRLVYLVDKRSITDEFETRLVMSVNWSINQRLSLGIVHAFHRISNGMSPSSCSRQCYFQMLMCGVASLIISVIPLAIACYSKALPHYRSTRSKSNVMALHQHGTKGQRTARSHIHRVKVVSDLIGAKHMLVLD